MEEGTVRLTGIGGRLVVMLFLFFLVSGNAGAGSISVTVTDSISNTGSGNSGDWSATHNISSTGSDLNFAIRNGTDNTYFGYRIVGQASADSTIFTGSDTATVSGTAGFGFTLPTGSTSAALWDIYVNVVYDGVAASDGTSATANAGNLSLSSTGIASGITDTLFGSGSTTNSTDYVYDTGGGYKSRVLPGTGSVSLGLYLGASSGGIGDEALAAIGQHSTLDYFSLNSLVSTLSDGAFITVTLIPHLNFWGQTLNSNLSLVNGENLNGWGTVNGDISGDSGSSITPVGGTLVLGRSSSTSGFSFNGSLSIGSSSSVTLFDSDYADLYGTASLSGGSITTYKGLRLAGTGSLYGRGTVNGNVLGDAGSSINATGSLTLGDISSSSGFDFDGALAVGSNSVTLRDSNYAQLGGATTLSGGTINAANGLQVKSTGNLTGYGTIQAGTGLTNAGTIALSGGATTVNGNVTNDGSFKVTNTDVTFTGTLTNNGAYISDPATTHAPDLIVGTSGYLVGGAGDAWILSNDFINQSTRNTDWDTVAAYLGFVSGADGAHDLYLPGADLGADGAGYANNFSWGTLSIAEGNSLYLYDGNAVVDGALYVGELLGAVLSGSDVTNIFQGGTEYDLNIYYNPSLAGNSYLGGWQYALAGGGLLSPVPIPSTVILFASGLLGLVGLGRRRLKA